MADDTLLWDLEAPPAYSPSPLYRLEPLGIGTPLMESLTGILKRLASAHHVAVSDLVAFCVGALVDKPISLSHLLWIDGVAASARMWSGLLCEMTRNNDMRYLTMFHWLPLLNSHGLIRRSQAWCPMCYESWRKSDTPVYEPLLWRLLCVEICLVHHRKLVNRCPVCHAAFPVVTYKAAVGFCPKCRIWLGSETGGGQPFAVESETYQIAQAVGRLLSLAPQTTSLKRDIVPEVIEAVKQRRQIPYTHIEAALRIGTSHLSNLKSGMRAPGLATLARLGILSEELLWNRLIGKDIRACPVPETRVQVYERPKTFEQRQIYLEKVLASPAPVPSMSHLARRSGFASPKALQSAFPQHYQLFQQRRYDEQRQALQDILDGDAIVTVTGMARQRGYQQTVLYMLFPELCRQVTQVFHIRKETKCRRYIQDLIEKKTYPSIKAVARTMGVGSYYLWQHFSGELTYIEGARLEQSRQEKRAIQRCLDDALASEAHPPQSLEAISQMFGKSTKYFKRYFPDQSQRILDKCRDYHVQCLEEECDRIRREVFALHAMGIYPSTDRLHAAVNNWLVHGTIYRRTYVEAMRACGYATISR